MLIEGDDYPEEPGYLRKFPLGFRDCYKCGHTYHFKSKDCTCIIMWIKYFFIYL